MVKRENDIKIVITQQSRLRLRYETVRSFRMACNYVGQARNGVIFVDAYRENHYIVEGETRPQERHVQNARPLDSHRELSLTFEITHTVIVGIHKTTGVNLIENRMVPPSSVEDLSRGQSDRRQQQTEDDAVLRLEHLRDCFVRFPTPWFICDGRGCEK